VKTFWSDAHRVWCRLGDYPLGWASVVIFASLAVMTIPCFPPQLDADFAWNRVLNFADQRGWQFGSEICFTYGPLGYLISPDFAPHAFGMRLAVEVALCATVAAGIALAAWQLSLAWRGLLMALFVWLLANLHPRADLLLYLGLMVWALLCLTAGGARRPCYGSILVMLAAFCSLAKVSLLMMSLLAVGVVVIDGWLSGRWRAALAMAGGYLGACLIGWMAAGQNLLNLGAFLRSALAMARDYDQTMGLEGLPLLRTYGLCALVPAAAVVVLRAGTVWGGNDRNVKWRRGAILAWGLAMLLMTWKHGFVRNGLYHAGFFFGFLPVLVMALEILPGGVSGARFYARALALATCLISAWALQSLVFPPPQSSLTAPFAAIPNHLEVLAHPQRYRQSLLATETALHEAYALPRLGGRLRDSTVDVFGLEPHAALFNGFNYHPRPIFQSYAAYSASLMRLNEKFLLSKWAPEFVLFDFKPIERRFPPLEDAMALRALLFNYAPVDTERSFLLLQAKSRRPARLTLLREGTVPVGAPIDLKDYRGIQLWLEMEIRPTWPGAIRRFFYRPPILRLGVRSDASTAHPVRFQAPAPMLAAGFVANPVLTSRQDLARFYDQEALPQASAYSLEVNPGGDSFWQKEVAFRLYRMDAEPGG